MNDLELESRLQREMQRVACGTRGPAPRAAQARYRTAPPPMAVISQLAVGIAAVSIALSVSVVAAAAVGGSSPNQVAQAVKHAVQKCQNDQAQPDVGRGVTECVSGLVPTSLPLLPKLSVPTPTAHASSQPGTAGSAAQGATPSVIGTGIPGNTPLATPSSGGPAPAGAVGPSPSAVPVSTPVPSSTPLPPTPTPSPTGTIGSGTSGLEPGPSPTPLPTPAPTAVPIPTP